MKIGLKLRIGLKINREVQNFGLKLDLSWEYDQRKLEKFGTLVEYCTKVVNWTKIENMTKENLRSLELWLEIGLKLGIKLKLRTWPKKTWEVWILG